MMNVPSPWVQRFAALIPAGEVLDLACGSGRHARLLAALGHAVLAVDRDPAALLCAAGPGIVTQACELEAPAAALHDPGWPFAAQRFAAIVVCNYLHRPLMAALLNSLKPDGVLIYETFSLGNAHFGKPSNPDFLLAPGELLSALAASRMRVVAFEEGVVAAPKPAMLQRLCAVGPDFPSMAALLAP